MSDLAEASPSVEVGFALQLRWRDGPGFSPMSILTIQTTVALDG